jgi:hypothetical protein
VADEPEAEPGTAVAVGSGSREPLRSIYDPPPLIGARRGRRTVLIDPPRNVASDRELTVLLGRNRAANVRAIAATARATIRQRGVEITVTPDLVDLVPTRELLPVRRPASYPAMTNYISKEVVYAPDGNLQVWSESFNERKHLYELAWEGVNDLNTQSLMLWWTLPTGRIVPHFPDFLGRDDRWHTTLYDIYAEYYMDDHRRDLYDLTAATCQAIGWGYEVGKDDISDLRVRNVRNIFRFGEGEPVPAPVDWQGRGIRSLAGLAAAEGGGELGWERAYARLWRREVGFDPEKPLVDYTALTPTLPASPRHTWAVPE